ncbi:SPFH domain-containing protein, partial [bacterium]
KDFVSLAWGTRDPVAFRDSELGLVRLRAHGIFNVKVVQPVLFVNSLVGTKADYGIGDLENYLGQVIVSRLNDLLGEKLDTLLNLPALYDQIATGLKERLDADFSRYGLALKSLYINAITPPAEVQGAIDERARLGAIGGRLEDLLKMKMAMALEKGASGGPESGGIGMGLGMGMGMIVPGLFNGMGKSAEEKAQKLVCPDCGGEAERDARFCPHCGGQILVIKKCAACGKNLPPKARFCPSCGVSADSRPHGDLCPHCNAPAMPGASFCNQCGGPLK